jgi:hypothetical protein
MISAKHFKLLIDKPVIVVAQYVSRDAGQVLYGNNITQRQSAAQ